VDRSPGSNRERSDHPMSFSDLAHSLDGGSVSGFMKKSFSIDSSLSVVSHHAAPRTHADRPAEHGGHGLGLSGLKTLHEST